MIEVDNKALLAYLLSPECDYFVRTDTVFHLNKKFSLKGAGKLTLRNILPRLRTEAGRLSFMKDVAAALALEIKTPADITTWIYTELATFFLHILREHMDEVEKFWETLKNAPESVNALASPC